MAVAGGLIAGAGLLLRTDWQRRLALLLGALLFLGGLMSFLMEIATSVVWHTPELPDVPPTYELGALIVELKEGEYLDTYPLPDPQIG